MSAFRVSCFAVLLAAPVLAQPPAATAPAAKPAEVKKPLTVEQMIAIALASNPDIRAAEAKLAQVQVERDRVRLDVVRRIRSHEASLASLKAALKAATERQEYMERMVERGQAPKIELSATDSQVLAAQAKLAELEAELPSLLGQDQSLVSAASHLLNLQPNLTGYQIYAGGLKLDTGEKMLAAQKAYSELATFNPVVSTTAPKPAKPPQFESVRRLLNVRVKSVQPINEIALGEAIEFLRKIDESQPLPKVQFRPLDLDQRTVKLPAADMTFGEWMLYLADGDEGLSILVREYGLLIASNDRSFPPGTVMLEDFLKAGGESK